MHRTQILLEDAQYQRLREESARTGRSIGELVRVAVERLYRSSRADEIRAALDESFGAATADDFDGLDGESYVETHRRGMSQRAAERGLA